MSSSPDKGSWHSGLITAFRTLTIIPLPGRDAPALSSSLPWFPFVGLALGAISLILAFGIGLATFGRWPELAAFIVVLCGALLTRGLHLDGLADIADGLGGGRDKKTALRIMKDSNVGAFGAIVLVLILMSKWVALTKLCETGQIAWIVVAAIVSRAAIVEIAVVLPYARVDGGTGESFVTGAKPLHRLWAWVAAVLLCGLIVPFVGAVACVLGWLAVRALGLIWQRRLGGATGDVLGASCEMVESLILIAGAVFAVVIEAISRY